ncbi:microcompartments protein, partial [mine drainage metagenome]
MVGTPALAKPVSKHFFNAKGVLKMANVSGIALGMIETRGLVPAIEAADAMTKAA